MDENVRKAVETLRNGGVILYPTDTVWGIGCDATSSEAVARVFRIKAREDSKSLVLLAGDLDVVCRYVRAVPDVALQLLEVSDSPLTLIYPDAVVSDPDGGVDDGGSQGGVGSRSGRGVSAGYGLARNVVAADDSVAMRIPLGGFCLQLARAFGKPIVSTSANISGEPTPKCFSEISDAIRSAVDYTVEPSLEAGATGKASSIIKISSDSSIQIIRK